MLPETALAAGCILPGYAEWQADAATNGDYSLLMEWADKTLACPVLPCTCTDGLCLRCRVEAALARAGYPEEAPK